MSTATTVTLDAEVGRGFRRTGAFILSIFAVIWGALGTSVVGGAGYWVGVALCVAISASLIALAVRAASSGALDHAPTLPVDWGRRYNVIGIAQMVGIATSVFLLLGVDRPEFIPGAVALIVGAHFVPLATVFGEAVYRWTGYGVMASGLLSLVTALANAEAARAVAGLGAAVVLWGTVAALIGVLRR